MMPPTPASSAGLAAWVRRLASTCSQDLISPGLPIIACRAPGLLFPPDMSLLKSPPSLDADSAVSGSHRPDSVAISEAFCSDIEPTFRAERSSFLMSFDGLRSKPCETRNRSTAVELPMTASPSPSLISWTASSSGSSGRAGRSSVMAATVAIGTDACVAKLCECGTTRESPARGDRLAPGRPCPVAIAAAGGRAVGGASRRPRGLSRGPVDAS